MDEETVRHFRYMSAQVIALKVCVQALVATHPNPDAFAAVLSGLRETGIAHMLPLPWDDSCLEVFEKEIDKHLRQSRRS
jgi:hypothetical protein